ncbi:kinetochore-associated protein NSL1 homolog [Hippocampus zosterae]|uniref:kinetochore-associated protein NSL1 homolog n=1 Tax=Hippocampus zosterae TaxID=109293 RepID=UPI00223CEA3A|nr:kinetochore-associated protein NSL1 homolog [Hippocampus zosterae]
MDTQTGSDTNEDFRVRLMSKNQVVQQMKHYKDILNEALSGQTAIPENTKRVLLEQLLADFEAAVQANVLVNGQTWDQCRHDDDEDKLAQLEKQMDDVIVETVKKRRTFPKQVLRWAVRALKAERRLADFYEKPVKPQQMLTDPQTDSLMKDLSDRASELKEHSTQVVKSICTLQKQAEGLLEVIGMKPSQASLEVHREVFGSEQLTETPPPSPNPAQWSGKWNRQSVRRDVWDAVASAGYVGGKKA